MCNQFPKHPRRKVLKAATLFLLLHSFIISAYATDENLDTTFGIGGKVITNLGKFATALAVAIQPDGKIVVAGNIHNTHFVLARYETDGSLDNSFGDGGVVLPEFGHYAYAVAIQRDGKIVVAGDGFPFFFSTIARFNDDGTLDSSFGSGGLADTSFPIVDLAIQDDGKIVIAGQDHGDFAVARFNSNGIPDLSFGMGGKVLTNFGSTDGARSIAVQPDGKIVVAGEAQKGQIFVDLSADFALVRYNTDGTPDPFFGNNGKVLTDFGGFDAASDITLQPDGRIVAAGISITGDIFTSLSARDMAVARYNIDGSMDLLFGTEGKAVSGFGVNNAAAVALQSDGKIVVAGHKFVAPVSDQISDFVVVRFETHGLPDTSFGSQGMAVTDFGANDEAADVAIQADGRIVVVGTSFGEDAYFALARYLPSTDLSPGAQLERLIADVNALVDSGLSDSDVWSLTAKLQRALELIDRSNGAASAGLVSAFVNEVNALANSNRISAVLQQSLIDAASDILTRL